MSSDGGKRPGGASLETLEREAEKLRKINAALMSRVERSTDQNYNAYALFETAIALDHQVLSRTQQLQEAMRAVERSNDTLYRAKQQAEAASSLKSSVLISVTHDLLQPLNAARLTLSTLTEVHESSQSAALIGQVDRSLATLDDLLRTLLDISKLDAGVLKPDVRAIPIETALFAPLRQEFAALAARRGLSLTIQPSAQTVMSDPMMLRRILQNLLGNALRYTRKGGVAMGARRRGDQLVIEVHDTGPGIPESQRQAIFNEFARGPSGAGDDAGFGLGLSIVRRFAAALGHDVHLASHVGHGSTFGIGVPRAQMSDSPDAPAGGPAAGLAFSGLEGARILLMTLMPAAERDIAPLLARWGCDVAIAASLAEAAERIEALGGAPDIIIAQDHAGVDAIQMLRERSAIDLPALIVSDGDAQTAHDAALQGLEMLEQPVKPAELRALLSFLLG